jgi:NAD kinase
LPRIAILGGSFDPPGRQQRELAERLAAAFDRVIVVPQGMRPDRVTAPDTSPVFRAAMADITFRGLDRVQVELFDLEDQVWTQPSALEERYRDHGEIWHVVPAELLHNGRQSRIFQYWERAPEMWNHSRFLVLRQPNEPLGDDSPAHREVWDVKPFLPASELRRRIFEHESVDDFVLSEVTSYIHRHGLYRGVPTTRHSSFRLQRPRFKLFFDPQNDASRRLAETLRSFESKDPEMIVVLGGDGTMLRAIRQLWRERLPFYGMNTGTVGFLLNDQQVYDASEHPFWDRDLRLYQLPLLWAEAETIDGKIASGYAFNEVWIERATGQTAWLNLRVNRQERIPKVVCDGMLLSTAAGSTAYARAMGGPPVPFTTPALILAGSNVLSPLFWRPSVLPLASEVEMTAIDPAKRPVNGYLDGVALGSLNSLRARASRTAAVELAFQPEHDPVAKLARLQFSANG